MQFAPSNQFVANVFHRAVDETVLGRMKARLGDVEPTEEQVNAEVTAVQTNWLTYAVPAGSA